MGKRIKNLIALVLFMSMFISASFAYSTVDCIKLFSKDADSVFLASLAAINAHPKFEISEIQSKNGYILFSLGSKYYLLTVTKRYQNQTEVKILPQNSEFDNVNIAPELFTLIQNNLLWE